MSKIHLRDTLIYVLSAAICLYVLVACILFVMQSYLVYFPQREILFTPDSIKLPYETVTFDTADHLRLSGWFVQAENPRAVVLFCHGNGGNISNCLESIRIFSSLQLSTFIFDYRGFGQSEGSPTEKGTYLDAEAAWDYLVQDRSLRPEEIITFGLSLGGAIAAWLTQEHTPGVLILQSTFTSVPDLASELYPFSPARWLSRFKYSTQEYLSRVSCPVMIIHSRDDEIVPYKHGIQLYQSLKPPKEFLEIRGDHNAGFILSEKEYMSGLNQFLSKYLKRGNF